MFSIQYICMYLRVLVCLSVSFSEVTEAIFVTLSAFVRSSIMKLHCVVSKLDRNVYDVDVIEI